MSIGIPGHSCVNGRLWALLAATIVSVAPLAFANAQPEGAVPERKSWYWLYTERLTTPMRTTSIAQRAVLEQGRRTQRTCRRCGRTYESVAELNRQRACYNCIDRHVQNGHGEEVALVWEGEPVAPRTSHLAPGTSYAREPEIRHHRAPAPGDRNQHHVGALEVAMDDPGPVRRLERRAHLERERQHLAGLHPAAAAHPAPSARAPPAPRCSAPARRGCRPPPARAAVPRARHSDSRAAPFSRSPRVPGCRSRPPPSPRRTRSGTW